MPNWGKLVTNGRAKAYGIPFNDEEAAAIELLIKTHNLGRPLAAEFVRDGVRTLEDYEKAKAKDAKEGTPLSRKSKDELAKEAAVAGIEITPDASKEALAAEVAKVKAKKGSAKKDV